jgi:hypothetical protein
VADATYCDFDDIPEEHESPCAFRIGGREWHCRNQDEVPFAIMRDVLADQPAPDQVENFFRAVLLKEEFEDFKALLRDPESTLSVGRVRPVIEFVSEHVFGRPMERPGTSEPGPLQTASASQGS